MIKGDIIQMPSGKPGRYEGGNMHGAVFTYLDADGQPVWDSHNQCADTVCIGSTSLLAKLQPEMSRV